MKNQYCFIVVIAFVLLLFQQKSFSQNLQFYKEDLTFEIKGNFFYVDGIYYFCNNGDKEFSQQLYYPFPVDSLYGAVDSVFAADMRVDVVNTITSKSDKGAFFKVKIESYGVAKYHISYRQKILKNKAEYILKTTQKWGKPFEKASYKLLTAPDLIISDMSYTPDSLNIYKGKKYYFWNKSNFMPDKNMEFSFK